MIELKKTIKEREIFYIVWYIIGHALSVSQTGIPNISYLIPLNLMGVLMGICMGNASYHASKGLKPYEVTFKAFKYVVICIGIVVFYSVIRSLLLYIGIDISGLYGY